MNEIQIIRQQLATERLHFAEVAQACAAALDSGKFPGAGEFATACSDYFAFALTRFASSPGEPSVAHAPTADAPAGPWREFLRAFTERSRKHFEALDALSARNPLVTEWRAASRIDADSIFAERTRYRRFKAAVP